MQCFEVAQRVELKATPSNHLLPDDELMQALRQEPASEKTKADQKRENDRIAQELSECQQRERERERDRARAR